MSVPRVSLLKEAIDLMFESLADKRVIDQVFVEQENINKVLLETEHLIDMAFVLKEHVGVKVKSNKIEYSCEVMDVIESKLEYFFQKEKNKIGSLLRVNYVQSFIEFKRVGPKQIYDKISEFQLKELREEVLLLYEYLIAPWIEKRTPIKYYLDIC